MLWHGWVQAVDCTSFQAKMSSQNSRHGRAVLVKRTDLSRRACEIFAIYWASAAFYFRAVS
jgi:hypothetical protein